MSDLQFVKWRVPILFVVIVFIHKLYFSTADALVFFFNFVYKLISEVSFYSCHCTFPAYFMYYLDFTKF